MKVQIKLVDMVSTSSKSGGSVDAAFVREFADKLSSLYEKWQKAKAPSAGLVESIRLAARGFGKFNDDTIPVGKFSVKRRERLLAALDAAKAITVPAGTVPKNVTADQKVALVLFKHAFKSADDLAALKTLKKLKGDGNLWSYYAGLSMAFEHLAFATAVWSGNMKKAAVIRSKVDSLWAEDVPQSVWLWIKTNMPKI